MAAEAPERLCKVLIYIDNQVLVCYNYIDKLYLRTGGDWYGN